LSRQDNKRLRCLGITFNRIVAWGQNVGWPVNVNHHLHFPRR
jgi:hypothetical protein